MGPSGGGKTTCVSLLERFYEPQIGAILLDGIPLGEYKHQYLHSKVCMAVGGLVTGAITNGEGFVHLCCLAVDKMSCVAGAILYHPEFAKGSCVSYLFLSLCNVIF